MQLAKEIHEAELNVMVFNRRLMVESGLRSTCLEKLCNTPWHAIVFMRLL
jgi:hypothetical protein